VPLGCLLGGAAWPIAARRRGGRGAVAPWLLTLVLIVRRLTAPLPDDATCGPRVERRALLYRLLYDRNTSR
jgi:hypothetical protein